MTHRRNPGTVTVSDQVKASQSACRSGCGISPRGAVYGNERPIRNVDNDCAALEACDLDVGYGARVIVSRINQRIERGTFLCALGPNGSGKTTLLRTLADLLAPLKGTVFVGGHPLRSMGRRDLAKSMAVVLTERPSLEMVTGFEFAAMGRYPHTGLLGRLSERDINRVWECLGLVDATNIADRYFNELSDGEKQKILFARALAQDPDVIILDEPTLHLDLKHKMEFMALLIRSCRRRGITTIASLHEVDLAMKTADLVMLIKNGRIMACGEPGEILTGETVSALYDLDCARFSTELGTIDFQCGINGANVFVVAGCGTGVAVYRALSKNGLGIVTGVVHENDIDFHVAGSVGARVIREKPFEKISSRSVTRALKMMHGVGNVIDTGFPVGRGNRGNLQLIAMALERGKRVYTLRAQDLTKKLFGRRAEKMIHCSSIETILDQAKPAGKQDVFIRENNARKEVIKRG